MEMNRPHTTGRRYRFVIRSQRGSHVADGSRPYAPGVVAVVSLPPVAGTERRLRAATRVRTAGRVRLGVAAACGAALLLVGLVHLDARADLRAEQATLRRARLEQAVAADDAARST